MAYIADASADQCEPERPLENIAYLAEEVERSAGLVRAFIGRFRAGTIPTTAGALPPATIAPVPSGYDGQLRRLRNVVGELDNLARELGSIG